MKHKHAELIHAWADGAIIEARYEKATGWTDWKTEDGGFVWYIGGAEYRIKPEPMRELTDEEIKDFLATFPIIFTVDDLCTFARAILKKASEK